MRAGRCVRGAGRRGGHLVPAGRGRTRDLAVCYCRVACLRLQNYTGGRERGDWKCPVPRGRGGAPTHLKLARQRAESPGMLVGNANSGATPLGSVSEILETWAAPNPRF